MNFEGMSTDKNDYNKEGEFFDDNTLSDSSLNEVTKILKDTFTHNSSIDIHKDSHLDRREGVDLTFNNFDTNTSDFIQTKYLRNNKISFDTFTVMWSKLSYGDTYGEFHTTKAKYYLSGYGDLKDSGKYTTWHIIDFTKFKPWWLNRIENDKHLLSSRLRKADSSNAYFVWIPYSEIPEDMIVASYYAEDYNEIVKERNRRTNEDQRKNKKFRLADDKLKRLLNKLGKGK